jgi:Uma2 family endonuclease
MTVINSLSQLDLNGTYSYADYLNWKFEEAIELIRGKILPMAAPSRRHQIISREINGIFYNYFQKHPCEFYAAPFDVRLLDKQKSAKANQDIFTVVQPDICIICDESRLDDKGCLGAPDLIVEILSPGNSSREMRVKKQLYEESQVREYLIFDPERETVHQFYLTDDDKYSPPIIYISEDVVNCAIFPDLKIDLQEVFKNTK